MRNIALFLTYEGTAYHGWQMQKNLATVQQTLEKAIAMVVSHPVHVTGCGRTDAGVHAKCYVANFRTGSTIPAERLPYALNTHLPPDIVVTKAFDVNENFNAIGSCVKKEYTYIIYNSRVRDPFYVNRAWFYPKHLDEKIMQAAADGKQGFGWLKKWVSNATIRSCWIVRPRTAEYARNYLNTMMKNPPTVFCIHWLWIPIPLVIPRRLLQICLLIIRCF